VAPVQVQGWFSHFVMAAAERVYLQLNNVW